MGLKKKIKYKNSKMKTFTLFAGLASGMSIPFSESDKLGVTNSKIMTDVISFNDFPTGSGDEQYYLMERTAEPYEASGSFEITVLEPMESDSTFLGKARDFVVDSWTTIYGRLFSNSNIK